MPHVATLEPLVVSEVQPTVEEHGMGPSILPSRLGKTKPAHDTKPLSVCLDERQDAVLGQDIQASLRMNCGPH